MGNGCCSNCLKNNPPAIGKAYEAEIVDSHVKFYANRDCEGLLEVGTPVHAEDQHSEVNYSSFLKECDVQIQEKVDFSETSPKNAPLIDQEELCFDRKHDEQFLSQNSLNKIYSTFERDPAKTSCETVNHGPVTEQILANNSLEDKAELFRLALLKPAMKKTVLKNGPLKPPTCEYLGKQNPFRELRSDLEVFFGQVSADEQRAGFGQQYKLKEEEYYEGHFEENQRNGPGNLYLANGDYYSGVWKDGKLDGEGSFVKPNKYM
jgi:hypothetical protein